MGPQADSRATFDLHLETPPQFTTPNENDPYELAKVTFDKTLRGHYRDGTTGYKRVGALFLTWEEDDLQCKETEVDDLRELFQTRFCYETHYFEIPKERWQTALHRRVADFCYQYDSPDCLTILYYGGHGYVGTETKALKLSAKVEADGNGDPTLHWNDILSCCRLPSCDQLLIVDCCHAANAFGRQHIGKRKFELVTSSGSGNIVPSPKQEGSFTKALYKELQRLLDDNPQGFPTSTLYREIYHSMPKIKPWLFDQSKHDYGRIWLRPQLPSKQRTTETESDRAYLKLTLTLSKEPSDVVMNELARGLQYLPHVDQIRFDTLHAPRRRLDSLINSVLQAKKLRPLIQKLHARRKLRQMKEFASLDRDLKRSISYTHLFFDQKHSTDYDWSSILPSPEFRTLGPSNHKRKKTTTWPPTLTNMSSFSSSMSNGLFSMDFDLSLPGKFSIPRMLPPRHNTLDHRSFQSKIDPSVVSSHRSEITEYNIATVQSGSTSSDADYENRTLALSREEVAHLVMWTIQCYILFALWIYMEE